jgi:copper transport protein
VFGLACLVVSGAVGHSAAINPALAIPGKSIHLIASALWLGGLLWLLATSGTDLETRRSESFRVSSYALIAVIAVLLSGLLQTVLFLNTPADLLSSTYGKLVIAKIIGVLILIGYGAYNRYSVLPEYAAGGEVKLRRSMKQEIMVMSFLILIGGFLAYISPPPPPASSAPVMRGTE